MSIHGSSQREDDSKVASAQNTNWRQKENDFGCPIPRNIYIVVLAVQITKPPLHRLGCCSFGCRYSLHRRNTAGVYGQYSNPVARLKVLPNKVRGNLLLILRQSSLVSHLSSR